MVAPRSGFPSSPDERDERHLREPDPTVEVPEALVHDLWRHQRFDAEGLSTTEEVPVQVLDPGRPNDDAGPDFSAAHVRVGGMDWRGDVEIHTTSGGWFDHGHHTDPTYNRVVLHVTLWADVWTGGLLRHDESTVPEIVLAPHLDTPLRKLLHTFRTRSDPESLPCAPRWNSVPESTKRDWIVRLARARFTAKRDRLANRTNTSLADTLHERLFAGLGYAKNDEAMAELARRVSPTHLRSLDDAQSREALLLGVAGLIPAPGELLEADRETADYAMALRDRFRQIQVQFDLPTMTSTAWTFFRLRPNNFPPLRLAQAAAWYAEGRLLAQPPLPRLRAALNQESPVSALQTALEAHPRSFWRTHYHLRKASAEHDPSLGPSRRDTLLVNAVAPVLLVDADRRDDAAQTRVTFRMLRSLPPPRDSVVRRFKKLGTTANSAFEAQGLHRLYRAYCSEAGCLDCAIGQHLLRSSGAD